MSEQTVKCEICGDPYKFYPFYAGDQSACPKCRRKAERNMRKKFDILNYKQEKP